MPIFTKRYHPAGTSPGTLTKAPPEGALPVRIRLFDYNADELSIKDDVTAQQCEPYLERDTLTWVHVEGHPTEQALRKLGQSFNLHPLALEDVSNSGQRPKVEPFTDQLFIVMSLPALVDGQVKVYQVSLFLGPNYVISFSEAGFEAFERIVARLQSPGGRIRSQGADYLVYSLLDAIIDHAFPVFEEFGQQLDDLEVQILANADQDTLADIHRIKRELIQLRRFLWPQREVINQLMRDPSTLISESTHIYLRDCYDHTIQVMDLLETYREMASGILDIYLSSVSNRMNDVMRVLTVIATIFIPLTFIVGIYGMNFDPAASPWNMPELSSPWGYLGVWAVMIVVAIIMVIFFRSRRWF